MKRALLLILFVIFCLAACRQAKESGFPVLKGPYLGQNPPGTTPVVFAPGIVNGFSLYLKVD
jgi:hypothetical protein